MYKEVGGSDVAIVFRDLIFEDQVISKGVPSELRYQAVVLVQVLAVVGEDDIRGDRLLERLEELLYLGPQVRKETVLEVSDHDVLAFCGRKKQARALSRLR